MGIIFSIFENKSHMDVEIKNSFELVEVLRLSSTMAMIITNWFYNKNGARLRDTINESNHYIRIYGDDLYEVIKSLEIVLSCEDKEKDLKALHYFPILYVIPSYVCSVDLWSDEYYKSLELLLEELRKVIPTNNLDNREREFFYNVSW